MTHLTLKMGGSLLIVTSLLSAAGSHPALASDFQLKPTLSLSEEYNDNVFETAGGRRTDLITRVQPGATLHYTRPDSVWDAAYHLDYLNYGRGTRSDEVNHSGLFNGSGALEGNFLYLDLNDVLSRVSQQLSRDVTTDSAFVNQVDQNLAKVSPYLLWRYSDHGSLKTGYSYTDVRYFHATGAGSIDRHQQDASAEWNHEILPKVSVSGQYTFSSVQSQTNGYDSHNASGGMKYLYAEGCSLFGSIGNSWQFFNSGARASNLFWDVGIIHDFNNTLATLESKTAVNTDPQFVSNAANPKSIPSSVDPQSISTKVTTHSARLDRKFDLWAAGLSGSYSRLSDTQFGGPDRTTVTVGATGSCEIRPSLMLLLSATGDKVTGLAVSQGASPASTGSSYPYHLTGTASLNYTFNHDITGGLSYTHVTYRLEPGQSTGSIEVNRMVVQLSKVF